LALVETLIQLCLKYFGSGIWYFALDIRNASTWPKLFAKAVQA